MFLENTEIEGRIVVLLEAIMPLAFKTYQKEIKQDCLNASKNYANNLKLAKSSTSDYPIISNNNV